MKYIRTKDGVYELVGTYYKCVNGKETYMYTDNGIGIEISEEDILKQADTIEELCDEFVAICQTNKNANYITRAPLKSLYEIEYKKYNRIVYGAVWTSKGLIFVAKMNDKGELVLI